MKYTVLLLRPDYIADSYGQDTRLDWVEADSVASAEAAAQSQASQFDGPADDENDPSDYHVLAVFEGHHTDIKED